MYILKYIIGKSNEGNGSHKVVFKGNKVHKAYFESTTSFFNYIDYEDNAKLQFDSKISRFKLFEDIEITGDLISDGDFDLDGHTLTIKGNYCPTDGVMKLNNGTLHITGDYRIETVTTNNVGEKSIGGSSAEIRMMNDGDKIIVDGDFVTRSYGYCSTREGYNCFYAGAMTIGGDFYQYYSNCSDNFAADSKGTHKVVLIGSDEKTIHFDSQSSYFNILELTQSKSNYTFSYEPCWNELIYAEHDHDYTSETTKEPTCTEAGEMKYTCKICDYFYTEPIPANGHKLTETPALAATCTTAGNSAYWTCSECGKHFSDSEGNTEIEKDSWVIKATSHSWKTPTYEWSEDGMTCTATRVCANNSSHKETETVNSTSVVRIAATCTEMGTTRYTAEFENTAFNSQSKDIQDIAAIGHSYVSEVSEPATCTEDGTMTYTCDCGDSYTETIKAAGHKYETTTVPPTDTEAGYDEHVCSVCGDSYKDNIIPANGHSYTSEITKSATCTEDGIRTYTCSCGDSYTEIIKASGHKYNEMVVPPTCTEKGYTVHTCSVCKDEYTDTYTKVLGHKYVDTVIAPTTTEQGYTHHKCTLCGDEYDDSFVDPIKEEAITLDIILNANDKTMSAENVSISIDGEAALASDNGSAELSLADGAYEITFSAYGFVPRTYTVEVKDGKLTEELTPELNLIGDADGNGVVNTLDIVKLKRHLIKVEPLKGYALDCANTDGNDTLNTLDIVKLKRHLINVEKLW